MRWAQTMEQREKDKKGKVTRDEFKCYAKSG